MLFPIKILIPRLKCNHWKIHFHQCYAWDDWDEKLVSCQSTVLTTTYPRGKKAVLKVFNGSTIERIQTKIKHTIQTYIIWSLNSHNGEKKGREDNFPLVESSNRTNMLESLPNCYEIFLQHLVRGRGIRNWPSMGLFPGSSSSVTLLSHFSTNNAIRTLFGYVYICVPGLILHLFIINIGVFDRYVITAPFSG